jgi:hypothetical protein
VRGTLKQVIGVTFGLAALLIVLEHAGGFSQVLESGARSYATAFQALTGHARPLAYAPGTATGLRRAGGRATA